MASSVLDALYIFEIRPERTTFSSRSKMYNVRFRFVFWIIPFNLDRTVWILFRALEQITFSGNYSNRLFLISNFRLAVAKSPEYSFQN
jgi:hypothetical protein